MSAVSWGSGPYWPQPLLSRFHVYSRPRVQFEGICVVQAAALTNTTICCRALLAPGGAHEQTPCTHLSRFTCCICGVGYCLEALWAIQLQVPGNRAPQGAGQVCSTSPLHESVHPLDMFYQSCEFLKGCGTVSIHTSQGLLKSCLPELEQWANVCVSRR